MCTDICSIYLLPVGVPHFFVNFISSNIRAYWVWKSSTASNGGRLLFGSIHIYELDIWVCSNSHLTKSASLCSSLILHLHAAFIYLAAEASFVCVYLPVFDKVQAQGRHLAVTAWHCLHSLTTADARFLLLAMRHTFSSLIQEYITYIRGYLEAIKIKSFGRCYKRGFSRNVTHAFRHP